MTIIEDFGAQGLTTSDINKRLISFSMILLSGGLCAREKQEVSARPQNAEPKANNFFVILWRHLVFHSSVKALFLLDHMKYRKREKTITTKCEELNFLNENKSFFFPCFLFCLCLTLDLKQSKKHLLQQSLYFQEGLPGILITIWKIIFQLMKTGKIMSTLQARIKALFQIAEKIFAEPTFLRLFFNFIFVM